MDCTTVDHHDALLGIDTMHVACPRAAGLDVHKMHVTASVRLCEPGGGAARTATRTFSALPHGLREMTDWLRSHEVTAAAMEGTGVYWLAPLEALEAAAIRPDLLQAQHVKQIRGKKTDINDSLWLARICQFDLALPSYVPPPLFRQVRQLTRYRRMLVGERSRARNRVHKTLDHDGLRLGGVLTDIFGVNGRNILDGLVAGRSPSEILDSLTHHVRAKLTPLAQALAATLDPHALFKLQMQLDSCDRASAALAKLDRRIATALADYQRPLRLLQTIPGIDLGSACTILAELGPDLGAFREPRHLSAWAGVAPGNNSSAGKRRSGRVRQGNQTLRATLAECAHGAARTTSSQFYGYHRLLAGRIGYKRAILATAHKLLRVIYSVLRHNRPYTDPGIDYEKLVVERNAPRWIRMLTQHGFLTEAQAATRG